MPAAASTLRTQDCILASVLALSLARIAQPASPKVFADALAIARHKKMPVGALAGASHMLYALGNGKIRPLGPNEDAKALCMAFNTADVALPSANKHSQHAARSQEEADAAATKEHGKAGAGLLDTKAASQHQQLHEEQRGGVQLPTSLI